MAGTGTSVRHDVTEYFAMAECGLLSPDDRIELLDGLIVAMSPQSPLHAAVVYQTEHVLLERLNPALVVRVQMPFVVGQKSVPEPDIAVVPGPAERYILRHPSSALLVVEVADSTVTKDRLTKAAIYAAADVPSYWIVNLRDWCVDCFSAPDARVRRYEVVQRLSDRENLPLPAFPGVEIQARELFPEQSH